MNMSVVTASTNIDKPKMVFAGVDAGAKILVELNGKSCSAAAAAMKQNNNPRILIALRVAELCPSSISIQKETHRLPFVWWC
jgi:hypothetical protein